MLAASSPIATNKEFGIGSPCPPPSFAIASPKPLSLSMASTTPTRKLLEPEELPFLQDHKPVPRMVQSPAAKIMSPAMMRASPNTSVGRGILKFDSPGGSSLVERRKKQLEAKWLEVKRVSHIKKTKWGMCKSAGLYKKKVVVEVAPCVGESVGGGDHGTPKKSSDVSYELVSPCKMNGGAK